jgi:hypothetical protein
VLRYPIINKFIISYAVTVAYMGTVVGSGTDGLGSAFVCVDATVCANFVYYGRKGCAVGEASNTTVTLIIVADIVDVADVMTVVDVVVVVDVTTAITVAVAGVFGDVTFGAFSTILS